MIGIIDYGLGNIKAFENIYNILHIPAKTLHKSEDFSGVTKLILPGVGAFDHAMKTFSSSGMRDIIENLVLGQKVPLIGICVGMQMLADTSEEGVEKGLGWLPGKVKKFDESKIQYETHLPHMGWNDVFADLNSPLFKGFPEKSLFYFLHSYYFECENENNSIAYAEYGERFTCAVNKDNVYGIQCHPEKSHAYGIQVLENFSKI